MRKAIISTLMLGFLLLSGVLVFIATTSDDIVVKNKITKLKKITDNTALALAKHYNINGSTIDAENVADGLLDQSSIGMGIKDSVVYTWDFVNEPNSVTVTIPSYSQDTFWYKFLAKDSFLLENLESRAEIVVKGPFKDESTTLAPLAINNCNRDDLVENAEIDFTFTTAPYFNNNDKNTFYGVDKDCSFPAGNSNFAHFKNLFSGGEVEYTTCSVDDYGYEEEYNNYVDNDDHSGDDDDYVDNDDHSGDDDYVDNDDHSGDDDYVDNENQKACLVQTSFQNPLSVDPKQLYNQLKHFNLPYSMDILLFECGTTQNDLKIKNMLSIELTNVHQLVPGPDVDGQSTNILKITAKVVSSSKEIVLEY